MGEELVAQEWLEYPSGTATGRVAPGEKLPADFPKDDVAELRKHGAIGSAKQYEDKVAEAALEAERQSVRAQAERLGLKIG